MDAKEAFDELRARFAARPYFPEVEPKLMEMRRRVEASLPRQGGAYTSGTKEESDAQRRPSTSLMRRLPPPIVRPAAVEALLHHAAPLPVWKDAEKHEKGGVADVDSDMSNDRTWEDYWGQRHSAHLHASGGRASQAARNMFNYTPTVSFPSGARVEQPPDAAPGLYKSVLSGMQYTHEAGGLQSPRHTLGEAPNSRSLLNGGGDGTMGGNARGEEWPGALRPPVNLYAGTSVERVSHAVQNNESGKETKGEAQKIAEEKVSEEVKHRDVRPIDVKEVPVDTVREKSRSRLAELDDLEKTHHDAVAVALMRTPLQLQQQRASTLGTDGARRGPYPHDASHGSQLRLQLGQRTAEVNVDVDRLPRAHAVWREPLSMPTYARVNGREIHVPQNLSQWGAANASCFEKHSSSSALKPSHRSSPGPYDAGEKWLNVSFL
ncbi:uncharacterized protein Tco025E_01431 [Trypanosoma conorhini]|uniref:Uncharacterized protein n=1 Tax=Trypanosoma conorhini TaxID=83891 RepID=A0A3S5IUL7_9TRYP|nr:uncharacterized protein Tco025E_01431 [Trypanosoma conorhini]RNF26639.1 hypothetical protein Tco025E_01431 [Trypanosoma conorhini]